MASQVIRNAVVGRNAQNPILSLRFKQALIKFWIKHESVEFKSDRIRVKMTRINNAYHKWMFKVKNINSFYAIPDLHTVNIGTFSGTGL